jgi:signal transduction histidine kinase
VLRPADLTRRLPNRGKRLAAVGWVAVDVVVAIVLLLATLDGYSERTQSGAWWCFTVVLAGALVIRRGWPRLAFVVALAAAIVRQLDPDVGLEFIDLAVPLTLYTLTSRVQRRRAAALALAAGLLGVALVGFVHVIGASPTTPQASSSGSEDLGQAKSSGSFGKPHLDPEIVKPTLIDSPASIGLAVTDAIGQGIGAMLVLGLGYAVGDGVRSRRAHLAALEQRAADLEREQQQRIALARATERARITRDLHDVVAHGLSVMVVQAQGAAAALDRHPDRAAEALRHVVGIGRDSLAEMRRLLDLVRQDPTDDAELSPQPGVGSLPELVDRVRATGTPVGFAIDGLPVPLPPGVDLSAYRIAQEALTNTIKHAGPAARAEVRLNYEPDRLELTVTDDGVGHPEPADGVGTGLRGIAERVAMLGGEWFAGAQDSGGFRVWARLPLRTREASA